MKLRGELAVVLVLFGCSAGRWERVQPASLPGAAEFPDADRLVLLDEDEVRFSLSGGQAIAEVTERTRIKVLRATADRPTSVASVYSRGFGEVVSLRGRVVHPDGTSDEADQSKLVDQPTSSYVLYDDDRVKVLPTPTPEAGAVWESEVVRRRFEPKLLGFSFGLAGDQPILERRVKVVLPPGWEVETAWRESQPVALARGTLPDGSTTVTLELQRVPAIAHEPLGQRAWPTLLLRLRRWRDAQGEQQAFEGPRALSAWLHALQRESAGSTPELDAVARGLAAEAGADPEARARAAHRYVCEKVQYCAIEVGLGGWRPHPAGDVQRLGYGDCKDKAMLLHVLLDKLGVESQLTSIHSHDGKPLPFGLPTLGSNFNHEILKVKLGGQWRFTDPTAEFVPFGELPANDLGADVLSASPAGEDLDRTPPTSSARDERTEELRLSASSSGGFAGHLTFSAWGLPASEWRRRLAQGAPTAQEYGKKLCERFPAGCTADKVSAQGLEKGRTSLELQGDVVLPGAGERVGTTTVVRAVHFGDWGWTAPSVKERRQDVLLGAPRALRQDVRLELASGKVQALPEATRLESSFGSYQLSWTSQDRAVVLHRELRWNQAVLPPERYAELRTFAEGIRAAEARALVVGP